MAGFVRDFLATLSPDGRRDEPEPGHDEILSRLDQRLASFTQSANGAQGAVLIRPGDCSVWDGNPRDQPGLSAESCRTLIDSIAAEGGNRIPVLVRANGPAASRPYELLVGSRRRFAVDWLNHNGRPELRLSALVVALSDEEAFRLADIENRERQDITELDRARSYQAALDRYYGGIQSRMAEALSLSNSQLSRLLALAQLPDEIADAFATRDELRVRHSEVLTPLLRREELRERLLAAARAIGGEQQAIAREGGRMLPPATVLARLKDAANEPGASGSRDVAIVAGGQRVGRIKFNRGQDMLVDLVVGELADLDQLLASLRETILAARSGALGAA